MYVVCMYMYVCMCVGIYVCMYALMYVCINVLMYVCLYVCMYVRRYVICMCVYVVCVILHLQDVPGGMCQTSGGYSLC